MTAEAPPVEVFTGRPVWGWAREFVFALRPGVPRRIPDRGRGVQVARRTVLNASRRYGIPVRSVVWTDGHAYALRLEDSSAAD